VTQVLKDAGEISVVNCMSDMHRHQGYSTTVQFPAPLPEAHGKDQHFRPVAADENARQVDLQLGSDGAVAENGQA